MAETKDSSDGNAEQAYAAAASGLKADSSPGKQDRPAASPPQAQSAGTASDPAEKTPETNKRAPTGADAEPQAKPAPAQKAPAKKAQPRKSAAKASAPAKDEPAAARKAAPKKAAATRRAADKKPVAPARKAPAARNEAEPTLNELKEKIMAKNPDITDTMTESMNEAVSEMQSKAQEAYDRGTAMVSEMTEVAKGNVDALVESGKIMAAGVQGLGKTYAEEAKTAYETMTADMKEMAAVKSPTELFQLQGKIMRRNFDMLVATSSKNTEAAMKLANDAMAPISSRVNVTVEKMSRAA